MQSQLNGIEDIVKESTIWDSFLDFLGTVLYVNEDKTIRITIGLILLVVVIYLVTTVIFPYSRWN